VTAKKYNAKNLLEHTVILKINTVPTSIFKGNTKVIEFIDGKDKVLFPAGSIKITPIEVDDEPKVDETKESESEPKVDETKESESEPKVTEKKETAAQARARKAKEAKSSKSKANDVKIETEDK